MTRFKIISRLTALSSVQSMLSAFRSRSVAAPDSKVDRSGAQRAPPVQVESPSWPPPEDMYWGM